MAQQFISRDGRTFKAIDRRRPVGELGHVLRLDANHWRMYISRGNDIRARMSNDGLRWREESDTCLKNGFDAAVAPLADRKFLMLFCTSTNSQDSGRQPLASMPAPGSNSPETTPGQTVSAGATKDTSAASTTGGSPAGHEPGGGASNSPLADWDVFTPADLTTELGSDTDRQPPGDPFPPKPDFSQPVDYTEWLVQRYPGEVENNALDAYDAFMPRQRYPFEERPGFPGEINDMFNGEYNGPIGPWDPTQHPEWEATHTTMQGVLDQFRQATRYEQYACPLAGQLATEASPDGVQPLVAIMLPSLAVHRAMMKATMADAWRAENGQADPARMVDAFETCLRNADHMEQGNTLIHHLVGLAEQSLVESNALIALQRNVFTSPEQMETALNTLEQYDRYDSTAATWLPTEHATALDTVQYLFPPGNDGQPHLNRERAAYLVRNFDLEVGGKSEEEIAEAVQAKIDSLAGLSPEEVRQSVEILDSSFRELREKWQTGYPQVRAKEVDDLAVGVHDKNGLLSIVMPSLARAYHMTGRKETGRRATQLTYEVHLFKAHNGRWPSSLDELPARPGSNSHTDPFTGGDFGYRLADNGPVIYTAGEDGQDNGGEHSDWNEEGNDYVFWPPKK